MMRGQWMEAASRRLFSPESFALLVEPAIADLQIEDSGSLGTRLDAYRTVWIGMAAACDDGIARRARAFVREHDLVTLGGLVLLHTAHSTWMVVLLLGLDDRIHLKRIITIGFAQLPIPAVLAAAGVGALYAGRAFVRHLLSAGAPSSGSSVVRVGE